MLSRQSSIPLHPKSNYHRPKTTPPPPKKMLSRQQSTPQLPIPKHPTPSQTPQLPTPQHPTLPQTPQPPTKNTQHQTSNNEKRPDTSERCSASIRSFMDERERLTVITLPADGYRDCRYLRHRRCRSHRRRQSRRRVSCRRRCRRRASSALPSRGGGCPAYRRPSPVFGA